MPRDRRRIVERVGAVVGVAGVAWLAPLMFDQLTFFGDREQVAAAAAARAVMPIPAAIVVVGALLVGLRRPIQGIIAVTPLVAVWLALAMPEALYQLLTYGAAAPLAIGSFLAAAMPLPATLPRPAIIGVALLMGAGVLVATAFLALAAALLVGTWWTLSRRSFERAPRRSALD
jgi:hypothetical protein